jgi:hypothetical protein
MRGDAGQFYPRIHSADCPADGAGAAVRRIDPGGSSAGRVSCARMSQIVKLLGLAPDLQERILFLPENSRLNERNLRAIVRQIDWSDQRRLFEQLVGERKE